MRKFVYTDGRTVEAELMSPIDMGSFVSKGVVSESDLTYFFMDQGFLVYGAENRDAVSILTQRNRVKLKAKSPEDKTLVYFFQSDKDWSVIPIPSIELVAKSFSESDGIVDEVRKTLIESCGYAEDVSGNELVHLDYAHINGYEVPNKRPIMSLWLTKKCTLKEGEVREYLIRHVLKEGTFSKPVKRLNWSGPAPKGGTVGGSIVIFEDGSALLFGDEEAVTNLSYWKYVATMKHRALTANHAAD